jgi:hypothetical protein
MGKYKSDTEASIRCGCYLILLIINFFIGGIATNYLLTTFLEKTIPFIYAGLIGIIGAEFLVPGAIITWILKAFGVF